jgi:predicted metal-dependent enzyme (double-stranded beta helix superfamily)
MFKPERFIEECREALSEQSPQSAMNELVRRTVSEPAAVTAALGEPTEGGIAVLHRSPELTVLNVVWAPEMSVNPHNHCMWAVIGVYGGTEDNTFFRRAGAGFEQVGGRSIEVRDTLTLGEHGVHAVRNSLTRLTGGLHVYGGDFLGADRRVWDPETWEESANDPQTTMRRFTEANERWAARQAGA